MDQQLVAWMLSGGANAERRDERLQRLHRVELRMADHTTTSRGWLSSFATSHGWRDAAPMDPIAQCCAA